MTPPRAPIAPPLNDRTEGLPLPTPESSLRQEPNQWHLRHTSSKEPFYRSSRWDCPYIIRPAPNGACTVYDTRKYANMKRIDFNFGGYSIVSDHANLTQAKNKVRRLMREPQNAGLESFDY